MNTTKDLKLSYFLLLFAIISFCLGFYIDEDSAGSGGFILDFNKTWNFVISLKNEMNFLQDEYSSHTPLHYLVLSQLLSITGSQNFTRLFYFLICFLTPYLFYKCLKLQFSQLSKTNLILIVSMVFFLPSFRSSAIWANSSTTALIFFLIFLYYFISWNKKDKFYKSSLSKEIFFQSFYLSLAVYTRQYYAYIYLFLMMVYLKNLKFKNFIFISLFVFGLSLPGFYLVLFNPKIIVNFDFNFNNTILVSSSIISFYLIPVYLLHIFNNQKLNSIFKNISYKELIPHLIISLIAIIMFIFFDYNYKIGGGFFLKLSRLIFDNNFLFFATSVIGLFMVYDLIREDKDNIFLIFILLLGFSYHMIFQKYFEPMFLFIYLFMIKSKIKDEFLRNTKSLYIFNLYFLAYLFAALINDTYKITNYLS